MRFRERDDDDLQINLTPLIDVVFLLLIFFMVSTTFTKESKLQIQLPEASQIEHPDDQEKSIEIEISGHGEIFVNGPGLDRQHQVTDTMLVALKTQMQKAAGDQPDPGIMIRADKDARHETVIRVMDAARRSGYLRISFATEIYTDPS